MRTVNTDDKGIYTLLLNAAKIHNVRAEKKIIQLESVTITDERKKKFRYRLRKSTIL
jgi:hypothetical protein